MYRAEIVSLLEEIGRVYEVDIPDDLSQLESLYWAVLIVKLEDTTGIDPFEQGDINTFPTTIEELASLYD